MALFRCTYSQGVGSGIPLVVTCASAFAGLTITCTDGTTTLTDTCPSSSPYEITFNLPNTGTWTVSGTISGTTYTESVLVEEFDCELKNNIDITVDFYSAASDTVSYTGAIDGETHTITTDSSGHASATITIPPTGATITFTSSVAKDPSNLSNDYSKAITLTSSTTSIYVMPNNTAYWYGLIGPDYQEASPTNGWSLSNYTFGSPTYNANSLHISVATKTSFYSGIGYSSTQNGTAHIIARATNVDTFGIYLSGEDSKAISGATAGASIVTSTSIIHQTLSISNKYVYLGAGTSSATHNRQGDLYALWLE